MNFNKLQKNKFSTPVFFVLVFLGLVFGVFAQTQAAFNPTINYQGKLTDGGSVAVPDGDYDMEFSLYTSPTGGSPVWTETLTGSDQVPVSNGLFSVMLGSTTPLTSVDFNQTLYLGVSIEADAEMTPRKILGAVPAAFEAEHAADADTVGGVASTSFLRSDQADTASGLLTFTGGIISNSSSTIANLTALTATTTNLVINSERFTDLTGTGLQNSSGVLTLNTTYLNTLYASTTAFDTSAELRAILTDETGTGNAVFSASPTFTGTLQASAGTFSSVLTSSYFNASGATTTILSFNNTSLFVASSTLNTIALGFGAQISSSSTAVDAFFVGRNAGLDVINAEYSNFIGYYAGAGATNAARSNFIGINAGRDAVNAGYSNFIGDGAGDAATNASVSNFIGNDAGSGATDAFESNFFGVGAGSGATDASLSNFFGSGAGSNATDAFQSNFFGSGAGSGAAFADDSNFFGYAAGENAVNADQSNFFGTSAGRNATNATYSNFIGDGAGFAATNANYSNFLGAQAGNGAINAASSSFLGYEAGYSADNAASSLFLGFRSGYNDTVNNTSNSGSSIAIGRYAGTGGFSNSIALGRGVINSAATQLNIGNLLYGTGIYNSDTQSAAVVGGGKIGIGTSTPSQLLTVAGNTRITGALYDNSNSAGTNGMVLQSTGTGFTWVATSTLGFGTSNFTSADIDTCSELAAIIAGETGTCGSLVLSASPTFTGTVQAAAASLSSTLTFSGSSGQIVKSGTAAGQLDIDFPNATSTSQNLRLFRNTNTTGSRFFTIYKGDGSSTAVLQVTATSGALTINGQSNDDNLLRLRGISAAGERATMLFQNHDGTQTYGSISAHDENDPAHAPTNHISIETPMGDLSTTITRLSILWGVDQSEVQISNADLLLDSNEIQDIGNTTSFLSSTTWQMSGGNTTNGSTLLVQNTSNGVYDAPAIIEARVGGNTTTGDPQLRLGMSGGNTWHVGVDNSNSDLFVIGTSTTVGAAGTSFLTITTAGVVTAVKNGGSFAIGDGTNTSTHMNVAGGRTLFGYNGANAVVQGGTGKGIIFNVNNSSFGSGTAGMFTSGGNFGLGTTTPAQKLTVVGNAYITGALYDNTNSAGTNGMVLQSTGSGFNWVATSTLGFGTGSLSSTDIDTYAELDAIVADATLTHNGLIDTSSELLSIVGDETGSGRLVFSNSPAFSGTATFSALTATSTLTLSGTSANIALGSNYLSGDGGDEGISVDANGNVGIGDATPEDLFEMRDGNLRITNNTNPARLTLWGDASNNGDTGQNDARIAIRMDDIDTVGWNIDAFNYGSSVSTMQFNHVDGAVNVLTLGDGTTAGVGYVGIGTTSPSSKLDVWGDFRVGTSSTPTLFAETSTGFVGIGTTSPIASLHVTGNAIIGRDGGDAGGADSLSVGASAWAYGSQSFAAGNNAIANADYTSAIGYIAGAYGFGSAAFGFNSQANGDFSMSLGSAMTGSGYGGNGEGLHAMAIGLGDMTGVRPMVTGTSSLGIFLGDQSGLELSAEQVMAIMGGNVGIGTTTPSQELTVAGDVRITGALYGNNNSAGTNGMVLQSTGSGFNWVATSTLGISANPFGASINVTELASEDFGSFTCNGTTCTVDSNALSASMIGNGDHGFFSYSSNAASLDANGLTSANLISAVSDETGSGRLVFSNAPAFSGTATFSALTATSTLTLSGTAANIALGSNYLSGDGGDEGVYVDSDGNVAIGTTTPDSTLHVHSSGNSSITVSSNASNQETSLWFVSDIDGTPAYAGIGQYTAGGANGLLLSGGNSFTNPDVIVTNVGRVGIGTTTPNQKLSIFNNGADAAIEFSTVSGANEKWAIGIDDSDGAKFKISSSSALGTNDRLVINGAGYVGIGDATPDSWLTVLPASGSSIGSRFYNDDQDEWIDINDDDTDIQLSFEDNTAGVDFSVGIYDTGDSFRISNSESLNTNPVLTILSGTQLVGIGTTTPTQELSVVGDLQLSGRIYDNSNSAGTNGMVLQSTGTGFNWVATSTLGITGGGGLASTDIDTYAELDAIVADATLTHNGLIDTSSELLAIVGDETGSGRLVFSNAPAFSGTATFSALTATSTLTMSGTAANIALGSNWLSGDGGDEGVFVDSNGNVGIGTTTTTYRFNVAAGNSENIALGSVGLIANSVWTTNLGFISELGEARISSRSTTPLVFFTGGTLNSMGEGTERLRITNSGNVAIGTSTPNQALTIFRSAADAAIEFSTVSGANEKWTIGIDDSDGAKFKISSSSALGTNDRLVINGAGYVGIGTSSPTSRLYVNGGNITQVVYGNPSLKGTYNTSGTAYGISVSGKYAYVADQASGLQIIDISNPTSPSLEGVYDTSASALGVTVSGKYAYVADQASGLQIIDISNPTSPSLVGTYDTSGAANRIYVSGKYAYVADTSGLLIIDISNPTSPSLTGTYGTVDTGYDLHVSGKYAYLANGGAGLLVIDISNPTSPSLVGTYNTSGWARDVYVSGKYAYVAGEASGLQIIDISNPTSPSLVGTYDTSGAAQKVYIAGSYAYVADEASGLHAINISSSTAPFLVGTYDTSGNAYDVYVSGKYAYVADGASGLQIIDINGAEFPSLYAGNIETNVLNATENVIAGGDIYAQGGLNVGISGIFSRGALGVFTASTTAANPISATFMGGRVGIGTTSPTEELTVQGDFRLTGRIYDSSNSAGTNGMVLKSTGTGFTWVATSTLGISGGSSLFTDGGATTYLTASTDNFGLGTSTANQALTIFRSAADAAIEFSTVSGSAEKWTIGIDDSDGAKFKISSSSALGTNDRLVINGAGYVGIGTSSPTSQLYVNGGNVTQVAYGNPTLKGTYNTSGYARGVIVSGKYAYVADDTAGLHIIDISNPSAPVLEGTYDTSGNAQWVTVSGKYAYVADFTPGLHIIDISNPTAPSLVGTYNTSGSARSVAISGKYAYVADSAAGLQIIDISNPASPSLAGTYDTSGTAREVTVSGKYAYVADDAAGLHIIDISNPASPSLAGTYNTSGTAYGVTVSGKYAYVADFTPGLHIIDISNPASPSLAGTYDTSSGAVGVTVSGKYAYVADAAGGLVVVNVFSPSALSLVGAYVTSGAAEEVAISGKYAYVGIGNDGLQVIDINGTELPSLFAGNIETDQLNVNQSIMTGGDIYAQGGLNVGISGIFSRGTISAYVASSTQTNAMVANLMGGNVGIGTTTSNQKLAIFNNGADAAILFGTVAGANEKWTIGIDDSDGAKFKISSSSALGTNDRFVINGAGLVGIGTATPGDKLHVASGNILLDSGYVLQWGDFKNKIWGHNTDGLVFQTENATRMIINESGNVGIGTTTPSSLLGMGKTGMTGSGIAGIHQYFTFTNSTASAIYYGDNSYLVNAPTATSTLVGKMLRIEDSTALGNTVRGLEVQAHRGTNTQGENTGISGFGRTFGVRGTTEGDAGGTFQPAGVFAQTRGTTQGNAIRAYSASITTEDLVSLFQDTSAFTGTGLVMNFGNSGGSFSSTSSKFIDLQNAGTSKFTVTAHGTTTIGDGTTSNMAGLQIGYGGLCVDNDGSCNASTTGKITSVSSAVGNSDLAEMYFSSQGLEPGDIIATDGILSIKKAGEENGSSVIGVVSTKPGLTLGFDDTSLTSGQRGYPVALSGRVPVKLSTENGAIKAGDKIMLSSIAGVGMKATGSGTIVGIALEDFDGQYAYSEGFVDQFGDDIAEPNTDPLSVEEDERIHDGCYFGGGGALGEEEEECMPRDTERFENISTAVADRNEDMREALMDLAEEDAQERETPEGENVRVGQALMFVNLGWHQTVEEQTVLAELTSTSTDLVLDGDGEETLWSRLKTLAQGFVDGILSVTGLRAENVYVENQLCVDGVCVTADDLRALLESVNHPSSGSGDGEPSGPPPESESEEDQTQDGGSTEEEPNDPIEEESPETIEDPLPQEPPAEEVVESQQEEATEEPQTEETSTAEEPIIEEEQPEAEEPQTETVQESPQEPSV